MNPKDRAGEAVPERSKAEMIAEAMDDLEFDVLAVMHLTDLASSAFERSAILLRKDVDSRTFRITEHEYDQITFLFNEVAQRADTLNRRFRAAQKGEVVS